MSPAGDVPGLERRLLHELGSGATVSAAVGFALWAVGHRGGRPGLASFGRQTVAWAAVSGTLAAGGWAAARRRRGTDSDDTTRARRLRQVLLVNAGLDVGYIVGGGWLARNPRRRGDGSAIAVQGAFLLWLDSRHARRFGSAAAVESAAAE